MALKRGKRVKGWLALVKGWSHGTLRAKSGREAVVEDGFRPLLHPDRMGKYVRLGFLPLHFRVEIAAFHRQFGSIRYRKALTQLTSAMLIPVGERRFCTLQASRPQEARCEKCRLDYVYISTRSATGSEVNPLFLSGGQADRVAAAQARARLEEALEHAIDPVPCPGCGWFQSNMIAPARRMHRAILRKAGIWISIPSLILIFPFYMGHRVFPESTGTTVIYRVLQAILTVALLLLPLRRFLGSRFEPNQLPVEERMRLGKTYAFTREAFQQLMTEARKADSAPKPGGCPKTQ